MGKSVASLATMKSRWGTSTMTQFCGEASLSVSRYVAGRHMAYCRSIPGGQSMSKAAASVPLQIGSWPENVISGQERLDGRSAHRALTAPSPFDDLVILQEF